VGEVTVTESAGPLFDAAATQAASAFEFTPAEVDGKPASIRIVYRYVFTLREEKVVPTTGVLAGTVLDTETKAPAQALRERTDSTVVPAGAVVAEAMVCLTLARCYREKFGGDHIDDVLAAIDAYKQRIDFRG